MIKDKKIIVTGGAGFLGSHIVNLLKENNEVIVPRSKEYNLSTEEGVKKLFADNPNVDMVIHAAADIGGIGYSATHPADQYDRNALINIYMLKYSYINKVKKFVAVGSVCEYPAVTPCPFKEDTLWDGYPVPTNDAYGLTKRMLLAQQIAYKKQYGYETIHLLPVNLYGPKDKFDDAHSHVIPALIKKVYNAKVNNLDSVEVWGTGYESREFVYVADAAKAIVLAAEHYNDIEPVNVGSGNEITIRELAKMIADIMDYKGEFVYINNGLGGQQRRVLDVSKAKERFGFSAETSFEEGLRNTINYFIEEVEK